MVNKMAVRVLCQPNSSFIMTDCIEACKKSLQWLMRITSKITAKIVKCGALNRKMNGQSVLKQLIVIVKFHRLPL